MWTAHASREWWNALKYDTGDRFLTENSALGRGSTHLTFYYYSLSHDSCVLQEKLWQCFLQKHEAPEAADLDLSRIDRMGMDAAKLHCCPRASTPSCRRLCAKTYSNEWTRHWDQFNSDCLSQITEDALVHCLDEGTLQFSIHIEIFSRRVVAIKRLALIVADLMDRNYDFWSVSIFLELS